MSRSLGRLMRIALGTAVSLTSLAMPGPVSAAPPGECPQIMDLDAVEIGQTGTGWTVVKGDDPRQFRAEILGVLPDAIGPGRDMIVFEATDAPGSSFIAQAGGIWSGMSGSPVYIGGKLVGAVAYGLTGSTSPIGGIAPAEDMVRILDYWSGAAAASAEETAVKVRVPHELRGTLAERSGLAAAQVASMSRLPVPVAFAGVPSRARQQLEQRVERGGAQVVMTASGATSAPNASTGRPVPGGNFAAVLSYGDISAAGIGTTTYVCGDKALAFGHPMLFMGRSALGANDAWSLAIVADPTFGSFKLANIAESFGTVDQDRLLGLRAALGDEPNLINISSRVRSIDTNNLRQGASQATMDDFVPDVGFFQMLASIDVAIDHGAAPGSARTEWTISGRRQNGNPWSYTNANRIASRGDISFDTAVVLGEELLAILNNPFENISFTGVNMRAWVEDVYRAYEIDRVRVSRNGGPFRSPDFIEASVGDELTFRVRMTSVPGGSTVTRNVTMTVPSNAVGEGFVAVSGGGSMFPDECTFQPSSSCGGGFMSMIQRLDTRPRNDSVVVQLLGFDSDGFSVLDTESASTDRSTFGQVEFGMSVSP